MIQQLPKLTGAVQPFLLIFLLFSTVSAKTKEQTTQALPIPAESQSDPLGPTDLTPKLIHEGWIALFDGKTLFGWEQTDNALWEVKEGAITPEKGKTGRLRTSTPFADYHLHLEFRVAADSRGSVFLRTPRQTTHTLTNSYQVNIESGTNGSQPNPWQSCDITIINNQIEVILNGHKIVDEKSSDLKPCGKISLQVSSGSIAFRNIRLQPLSTQPLLRDQNLTGWNSVNMNQTRFEMLPTKELRVQGGPGQLETNKRYGNFLLQLECIVDGDKLNSGVFFRSISGKFRKIKGYESQIQNSFLKHDGIRPNHYFTGAIYHRQKARQLLAHDHEWFAKTLVADGPHFSVWVNGFQVTDVTDSRPPNENPRLGSRITPGFIILQGHDPETNVRFRNLRIGEQGAG